MLGRPPSGPFTVAVRRGDGSPAVIENAPLLDDGRPMPTRYWLVDPVLREAVSRLEAAGGVRRAAAAVPAEALAEAHARHAAARDRLLPEGHAGPRPSGGVGGTRRGVKCLHAHLAWYLAGGDDPVGRWTAAELDLRRADFVPGRDEAGPVPVAALDCGTNSTRLLVLGADGAVVDRQMRITRLGERVDATRLLDPAAVERTVAVLRDYRRSMDDHGVLRARLVATSAVRDAANAEVFMRAAAAATGVEPEILSGDEEGRLSFAGATAHLPPGAAGPGPVLVVDVGGGSTEISAGLVPDGPAAGAPPPEVVAVSLDVGCVRVSERFLRHDPPRPDELAAARQAVDEALSSARRALPPLAPEGPMVGLAGTVSTLAALQGGVAAYDRARIHHVVLARPDVERWLRTLAAEDSAARLARPGMVEGRADVIVGGVLVLVAVMDAFDRPRLLVSEDDILDGLAASIR